MEKNKLEKTKIIAEIANSHQGKPNNAIKLANKCIEAGADAVKFQIWNPKFLKKGKWDNDGRRKIYEKAQLTKKKYLELKKFSRKNSIRCFSSVFNIDGLKLVKSSNDTWIKIPSHEAYNFSLIKDALKNFKKVIISAGCLKRKELIKLINLINSKKKIDKGNYLLGDNKKIKKMTKWKPEDNLNDIVNLFFQNEK